MHTPCTPPFVTSDLTIHNEDLSVVSLSSTFQTMDHEDMYTVIVSGMSFRLSGESILSDGSENNILVKRLIGRSENFRAGTITFDRDPITFALVRDHLRGYTIFPLDKADCADLSEAKALRYVQDDAKYYGLKRLQELVETEILRTQELASKSAELENLRSHEHFERVKETHKLQFRRMELEEANTKHQARIAAAEQHLSFIKEKVATHSAMTGHGMQHLHDKGKVYDDLYRAIDNEWAAAQPTLDALAEIRDR